VHIEIEQLPALRVGAVRHVGPYTQVGKAFERLGALAGPAGLFQMPDAVMLGIYHDDPQTTPNEQLRADAAVVVKEGTRLPDGLTERVIPAGRYARATHVGAYDGLPRAWAEFGASLGSGGYSVGSGPGLEIYRNDMARTPQDELRTDLYMPLD